jgi:S1-C subfamily serine protease
LGAGAPVALIGFPLGGETAMPGTARSAAKPLVTAGIVTSVAADRLEVRGYGAAGASGSPILDGDGKVLGILFGGRVESGQSVVVAVPARAATELLEQIR